MPTLIWDWNGTLLNDVKYSVETINTILKKYNLKQITVSEYRKIFTFPVIDYYKSLGFDFNKYSFEVVGMEFIELYNKNLHKVSLTPYTKKILAYFHSKKYKQVIISAREHKSLLKDLRTFGIDKYFDSITGIDNNYAYGKEQLFVDFFNDSNNATDGNIFLIGDTIHDCQIAEKFSINFILFENGHQELSHFEECKQFVKILKLRELKKII